MATGQQAVGYLFAVKELRNQNSHRPQSACYVAHLLLIGSVFVSVSWMGGTVDKGSAYPSFELSSGVVIGVDPPVVYVMHPDDGIAAVDLNTGNTLWKTTELARPLVLVGTKLLVQKSAAGRPGVLPIGVVDVRDGTMSSVVVEIQLTSGTHALIDERIGESFSIRAWEERGDLIVAWGYVEQRISGISPRPGESPIVNRAEAAARVDLESGSVEYLATKVSPRPSPLPPRICEGIKPGEGWAAPWRVGDVVATFSEQAASDGKRRVVLRRWGAKTGKPLPERILFEGRPLAQLLSADRHHLLLSSQADYSSGTWESYLWTIFAVASGELVGTMPYHRSADHFAVVGTTLIHLSRPFGRRVGNEWIEEPLKLCAVDLGSGIKKWSVPLRDTAYRGPQPSTRRTP